KMMQKRFELTAQVVKENKFETYEYRPKQGNLLGEALEVLLTTSIISLELGITYKENPLEIPWVDWFKKQLAK
ncbi:MAG: SIS domain-containing protein, partial [Patescibacteria group bacterium]